LKLRTSTLLTSYKTHRRLIIYTCTVHSGIWILTTNTSNFVAEFRQTFRGCFILNLSSCNKGQERHCPPHLTNGTASLSPPGTVQLSDIDHIPQPSLYPKPTINPKPAIIYHSIPTKATQSTHSSDIVSSYLLYPCTQQLKSYCTSSQVHNCCCQGREKIYVSDVE
jgi:hypothetical protein